MLRKIIVFLAISSYPVELSAEPNFLTLPFKDPAVFLQQGPIYADDGSRHLGAGLAFDFAKGILDSSSTWESFDVVAAADGLAMASRGGGYGNLVLIRHDEVDDLGRQYFTLYAHLEDGTISSQIPSKNSRHDTNYVSWTRVSRGDLLGRAGQTGKHLCQSATCIHLHFEVFRGGYFQNPIDPYDISITTAAFTRDAYPPPGAGCGPAYIWTTCPPDHPPTPEASFWTPTTSFTEGAQVGVDGVGIDQNGVLYAITNRSCQDQHALGAFRSPDGGQNWEAINSGLVSTNVRSMTIAPSDDVYVGAHDGVYRLASNRTFWEQTALRGVDVSVLFATEDAVYAADGCFCTGVRRTTNQGQSWQTINSGLPTCVNALAANSRGDIFAGTGTSGVYRLPKGTSSWQSFNAGLGNPNIRGLAVDAADNIYAATVGGGILKYTTSSGRWTAVNNGLSTGSVEHVSIAPNARLFTGTQGSGIFTSTDHGSSWTEANDGILNTTLTAGAFTFASDGTAFASVGSRVYRSSDSFLAPTQGVIPDTVVVLNRFTAELFILEPGSGDQVPLGTIAAGDRLTGLAFDRRTQNLYTITENQKEIVTFDLESAQVTATAFLSFDDSLIHSVVDLTYGPGGLLYGMANRTSSSSRLVVIDPESGIAVSVGPVMSQQFDGLVYDHDTGRMYATSRFGFGALYELDPVAGGGSFLQIGFRGIIRLADLPGSATILALDSSGRFGTFEPPGGFSVRFDLGPDFSFTGIEMIKLPE